MLKLGPPGGHVAAKPVLFRPGQPPMVATRDFIMKCVQPTASAAVRG